MQMQLVSAKRYVQMMMLSASESQFLKLLPPGMDVYHGQVLGMYKKLLSWHFILRAKLGHGLLSGDYSKPPQEVPDDHPEPVIRVSFDSDP